MTTKEEMLLALAKLDKYETVRDYCGPCKGAGHFHQLTQKGDRLVPESLACSVCYGVGFTPRNTPYILLNAFNTNNKTHKISLLSVTENNKKKYICFVGSQLEDVDVVSGSDEFEVVIKRIYYYENQ